MFLVRHGITRRVLAWRVRRCDGWLERAVGFLPRKAIAPEEGLWFEGCGAVHTVGMRVPLDIVFLDDAKRVVKAVPGVQPYKPYVGAAGATTVAEFGPGFLSANPLRAGDKLELEEV